MKIAAFRFLTLAFAGILISVIAFGQKSRDEKTPLDAAFIANIYTITAGDCVNFTDMSTGSPTAWQWSFPGACWNLLLLCWYLRCCT
jgi:hypothetical protein